MLIRARLLPGTTRARFFPDLPPFDLFSIHVDNVPVPVLDGHSSTSHPPTALLPLLAGVPNHRTFPDGFPTPALVPPRFVQLDASGWTKVRAPPGLHAEAARKV